NLLRPDEGGELGCGTPHQLVHVPQHQRIVSFRLVNAGRAARRLGGEAADVADLVALADVVAVERHGTTVCYADVARRRRLLELDRHGTLLLALRWHDTTLAEARVRIPDRTWLRVEPRAAAGAPWGRSDRLYHARTIRERGEALSDFDALDWTAIDRIPTLAEPARLPAGAGTAVLNVIASLARDQGRGFLRYPGPYPTEQLFTTLLDSFHYDVTSDDPLAAFMRGALAWRPAPHERVFTPEGACVCLRERVEKVVWRSRVYQRPDVQGVGRHAAYRVRDEGGRVVCSLWALGTAIEDVLELTQDGHVKILEPASQPAERRTLPAEVAVGIGAVVAATSVPALGPPLRAAAPRLALAWGPPHREPGAPGGGIVWLS